MAYRKERVVEAAKYTRPKEMAGPFDHDGVVVRTDKGNSYLIHNTPGAGVVATPAENMSSKWKHEKDLEVNGHKTVGDALQGGYTSGSGKLGKGGEYVASGFCIGTAIGVANALKK